MRTFREAILAYIADRKLRNVSDSQLHTFVLFIKVLQCYLYGFILQLNQQSIASDVCKSKHKIFDRIVVNRVGT